MAIAYQSEAETYGLWNLLLYKDGSNYKPRMTTGGSCSPSIATGTTSIGLNTWNFICGSGKQNGYIRVYLNGVEEGNSIDNGWNSRSTTFEIGAYNNGQEFNGTIDEFSYWDRQLKLSEIQELYNDGNGFSPNSGVILNSPVDNYVSPTPDITLNGTAIVSDGATLTSMSLWDNSTGTWHLNQTSLFSTAYTTRTSVFTNTYPKGSSIWNIQACDSDGDCGFATENRTLAFDSIDPTLSIIYPTNGSTITDNLAETSATIYLNYSVTDANLDTCWYNNQTANVTITCGTNATFNLPYGTYTHYIYANDTIGNLATQSSIVTYDFKLRENSQTFNTTSTETATESFVINTTWSNTTYFSGTAKLWYNGTSHDTTSSSDGTNTLFSSTIDIPLVATGEKQIILSMGNKFSNRLRDRYI